MNFSAHCYLAYILFLCCRGWGSTLYVTVCKVRFTFSRIQRGGSAANYDTRVIYYHHGEKPRIVTRDSITHSLSRRPSLCVWISLWFYTLVLRRRRRRLLFYHVFWFWGVQSVDRWRYISLFLLRHSHTILHLSAEIHCKHLLQLRYTASIYFFSCFLYPMLRCSGINSHKNNISPVFLWTSMWRNKLKGYRFITLKVQRIQYLCM